MAKIAIIGSRGVPANYGGFETLAENLVKRLGEQHDFIVYCSRKAYDEHPDTLHGAKLRYLPLDANGWQSIPYDIWSMIDAARRADILLVLGVSGCAFLPVFKLFSRKKVAVNLDGLDWARPKWGRLARTFLKFSEALATRWADVIIADNSVIQEYVKEHYGKESRLLEYGGDNARIPRRKDDEQISVIALHPHHVNQELVDTGFSQYAVSVCRIEPENHVHLILEAFSRSGSLPLVFIGNWSSSEYGRTLRDRFSEDPNILLLDPIFEPRKLFALRNDACLYVHGHSSGGTNPSLVESMALGLPVIAFNSSFNVATTEGLAHYFSTADELIEALEQREALDLDANARRMQDLARQRYSWARISAKYDALFCSLVPRQKTATENPDASSDGGLLTDLPLDRTTSRAHDRGDSAHPHEELAATARSGKAH